MKKVISIVGARPNFVKLTALHPHLKKFFNHIIVHTGQHYDYEMSQNFFDEFSLPKPNYNLEVGSADAEEQIKLIRARCQDVIKREKPDIVLVYGDTNSTIGGAQSANGLRIPVAHIEAGVRCFSELSPEESNRIIVDNISNLLLAPTKVAVENLKKEGITKNVFLVGDVMYDIFLRTSPDYSVLRENKIKGEYFFATIHRQENTDNKAQLKLIIKALNMLDAQVVIPLHPRTEKALRGLRVRTNNLKIIKPVKYSQSIALQKKAKAVITDSGGIQKEAYWLKIPCITVRDYSEWPETISSGWNKLIHIENAIIQNYLDKFTMPQKHPNYFGNGQAAVKIVKIITKFLQ